MNFDLENEKFKEIVDNQKKFFLIVLQSGNVFENDVLDQILKKKDKYNIIIRQHQNFRVNKSIIYLFLKILKC